MKATLERTIHNPGTETEKEIASLGAWFHNLHLPDGTQTAPDHPLGDFPRFKWNEISPHFPRNMTGYRVLDIGCNAGFYSFEFAKRGADVLGVDIDPSYLRQAEWAKKKFKLDQKVRFRQMKVYELITLKEQFDIVLFMGVFYHLRHPLLALDIVSTLFTDFFVFQTLTLPGDDVYNTSADMKIDERYLMYNHGWPKMAFIENALEGDFTNWWAPNLACIEAMVRSCGMEVFKKPAHEIYFCRQKEGFDKVLVEQELQTLFPLIKSDGAVDD